MQHHPLIMPMHQIVGSITMDTSIGKRFLGQPLDLVLTIPIVQAIEKKDPAAVGIDRTRICIQPNGTRPDIRIVGIRCLRN
jgi:hypothetical protein